MANLNIAIQIAAQDSASGPIGNIKGALSGLAGSASAGFAGLQTMVGAGLVGAAGLGAAAIGAIGTAAFGVANEAQSATQMIMAQLGLTADEAERLGDIAQDVWANNFGANITDAAGTLALVRQQLGDMADNELQRATENAFRLSDSFGIDTAESVSTVKTLMDEFGLTADQAFDFITTGMQQGLNKSDDFIDSIGEYSNLFSDAGFDAGGFFSIMETGAAGGVLGVDKISDALKEFGIIMNEGGQTAQDALAEMGMDWETMQGFVADGTTDWAGYFDRIVENLNSVEDPIKRSQLQVALFGTMAEDLGVSFTEGLSTATTALEDMEGATGSLDAKYNTLGDTVEGWKRRALDAIEPIGGALLGIANDAMPLVNSAFDFFETNVVPALELAADVVGSFIGNLQEGMSPLDAFIEAIWGIAPPEVLAFLVSLRDDILPGLMGFFQENVQPIIDFVMQFVSWKDVLGAIGVVVASVVLPALGSILAGILPVIAVGAGLVAAFAIVRNAWENDWGGIRTFLIDAWENSIRPALEQLWQWLQVNVPLALETLKGFWETVLLPAIQNVWGWISGTLMPFLSGTVVPMLQTIMTVALQALADYWTTVLWPAIQNVWGWISGTLMPFLSGTVVPMIETILTVALQTLANFWTNTLLPAIEGVWGFIQDPLMPLFDALRELLEVTLTIALTVLQGAWENILLPAIESVWGFIQDNLVPIVQDLIDILGPPIQDVIGAVKGLFGELSGGLDGVKGAIQGVIDFINNLIDALNNIEIPEILTPGSPTPFEMGLRGIIGAVRELNPELDRMNGRFSLADDLFGGPRIGRFHLIEAGTRANRPRRESAFSLADSRQEGIAPRRGALVAAGGQLHVHLHGVQDAAGLLEELSNL